MDEVLRLERTIDLPRSIVWDALVDPVLAEGWLHPEARLVDGAELHERRGPGDLGADEIAVLDSTGPRFGRTRFELTHFDGGTRGSLTRLVLVLPVPLGESVRAPVIAGWQTRLDQLEELLLGHPVDWASWMQDHGSSYENHLLRAVGLVRP